MIRTTVFVGVALLLVTMILTVPAAYMHAAPPFFNSAPTAVGDSYTLHGNGSIGSILANDFDPDPGDTIFPRQLTSPTNGSLTYLGNGNFSYSRFSSGWTGTDSFTYKACDNQIPSLCFSVVTARQPCKPFGARWVQAMSDSNGVLPGLGIPTGVPLLTGSTVAKTADEVTFLTWLEAPTAAAVPGLAVRAGLNNLAMSASWEGGLAVSSYITAAGCPCGY